MLCFVGPFRLFWTVYSLWRKNTSFPLAAPLSLLVAAELHNMPSFLLLLHLCQDRCFIGNSACWGKGSDGRERRQHRCLQLCQAPALPHFPLLFHAAFSLYFLYPLNVFIHFLFLIFSMMFCFFRIGKHLDMGRVSTFLWGWEKCLEWIVLFKTPFYSGWCGCLFEILCK